MTGLEKKPFPFFSYDTLASGAHSTVAIRLSAAQSSRQQHIRMDDRDMRGEASHVRA